MWRIHPPAQRLPCLIRRSFASTEFARDLAAERRKTGNEELLFRWKSVVPESDLKLQNVVMSYWTNFVKTLNPNGRDLPVEKSFRDSRDAAMVLDQSVGMRAHPRGAQLDFFRLIPGRPC